MGSITIPHGKNSDNKRDSNILHDRCFHDCGVEVLLAFIYEDNKIGECLNVFIKAKSYLLFYPFIGY